MCIREKRKVQHMKLGRSYGTEKHNIQVLSYFGGKKKLGSKSTGTLDESAM